MKNFYTFSFDFEPSFSTEKEYGDDEATIEICPPCKKFVKNEIWRLLNKQHQEQIKP